MLEIIANLGREIEALVLSGPRLEIAGQDMRIPAFLLVFLGVLIAVVGIRQMFLSGDTREAVINRRLRMKAQGIEGDELLVLLAPQKSKPFFRNLPFVGDLELALKRTGIILSPQMTLVAMFAGWAVAILVGLQLAPPFLVVGASTLLFLILPLMLLGNASAKYNQKFVKQLPDALDLMARGLKVGHPVNVTLQSVAEQMPDPIGTEFGNIVDLVAYGEDLPTAMSSLAERMDLEDVTYLAIAIGMQHGTGGDLASILNTLARTIRARMALRKKVKAISSEGRMTAYILSSLPVIIAVFVTISNPTYYGDVMHFPIFWPVMAGISIAVVLNAVILLKLVNFRV